VSRPAALPDRRPVLILGMHRSGTSCLAGCLEEAGLHLGRVNRKAIHNARGNNEPPAVNRLHDAVLAAAGGRWDAPPPLPVAWPEAEGRALDTILAGYPADRRWGVKDPRLTLLHEAWRARRDLAVAASIRHPLEVAASLARRNGMDTGAALALWAAYNRRLLALAGEAEVVVVDFSVDAAAYTAAVAAAARRLALAPPAAFAFLTEALRHHHLAAEPAPASVAGLWAELRALAVGG